jgi:hypothetical protein
VNRLNKTKAEKEVDHESERQERLRIEGRKKKLDAVERVRHAHRNYLPLLRSVALQLVHPLNIRIFRVMLVRS